MTSSDLRGRLRALAMLADRPDDELAWLEAHGSLEHNTAVHAAFAAGDGHGNHDTGVRGGARDG